MQIEANIYHGDESHILDILRALPDGKNTVFLFGHNPTMNYLATLFSGKHMHIPTCGIQWLVLNISQWAQLAPDVTALKEFIYPKQYIPEETND